MKITKALIEAAFTKLETTQDVKKLSNTERKAIIIGCELLKREYSDDAKSNLKKFVPNFDVQSIEPILKGYKILKKPPSSSFLVRFFKGVMNLLHLRVASSTVNKEIEQTKKCVADGKITAELTKEKERERYSLEGDQQPPLGTKVPFKVPKINTFDFFIGYMGRKVQEFESPKDQPKDLQAGDAVIVKHRDGISRCGIIVKVHPEKSGYVIKSRRYHFIVDKIKLPMYDTFRSDQITFMYRPDIQTREATRMEWT